MKVSVTYAARQLEERGLLKRRRSDQSERLIAFVRTLIGRDLPPDLIDFYRERIDSIGEFTAQVPLWNDYVGWKSGGELVTELLAASAVPLFDDGCGNLFGLDITPGIEVPAVYFFDKCDLYEKPSYAAGSSLGAFLLLLADHDLSYREGWPEKWELKIDPDIDACPRARAIWAAG